jgi:hypothetical protein
MPDGPRSGLSRSTSAFSADSADRRNEVFGRRARIRLVKADPQPVNLPDVKSAFAVPRIARIMTLELRELGARPAAEQIQIGRALLLGIFPEDLPWSRGR